MPSINEIRQKYPQYSDLSDDQLAQALHAKHYSDIPFEEFSSRIGLKAQSSSSSGSAQMTSAGGGATSPPAPDLTTRATQELPELFNSGFLQGKDPGKIAKFATFAAVTPDPRELANIATEIFPEIGVQEDEKGNILLGDNETGRQVVVNKPGASAGDVFQTAGIGSLFAPVGRVLGPVRGALTAGGMQAAIETGQAASGGDFDPAAIAVAGGIQPTAQAATTLSGPRRFLDAEISESDQAIIKAGQKTNVPVLTTDLQPPKTIVGGLVRQFGERIPFLGTGGVRGAQQQAREKAAREFAEAIPPVNDKAIIESLKAKKDIIKTAAGNRYQRITEQMDQLEQVPTDNTLQAIDEAISGLSKPGTIPDAGTIADLRQLKEALSQPQTFSLLKENRTYLSDLANRVDPTGRSQLPTKSRALLTRIRSAMTEDMDNFVKANDEIAFNKYKQADQIYAEEAKTLTKSRLKNVLDKGDVTPEQYRTLLFSGKESEQALLYKSLTNEGRANARIAILDDVVQRAGGIDNLTPDTLNRELKRRSSQIDTFFKGERKEQLKGFQRLLEATKRAAEAKAVTPTGQALQTTLAVGAGAGAATLNPAAIASLFFAGTVGAGARIYESSKVRNLMRKLANTPRASKAELETLKNLDSAINAIIQPAVQFSESAEATNF